MWQLFLFFLQLGFLSFGGGYALIPIIERENATQLWLSHEQFVEATAVAGMTPGSAAINLSTIIGYEAFGIGGAIAALLGLLLPSVIIAALILFSLKKLSKSSWIDQLLHGIQPFITAMIVFAVYRLGVGSLPSDGTWTTQLPLSLLVIGVCLIMLMRYRMHPIYILLFSGISGAAFLT